jgi:hypothetical protein
MRTTVVLLAVLALFFVIGCADGTGVENDPKKMDEQAISGTVYLGGSQETAGYAQITIGYQPTGQNSFVDAWDYQEDGYSWPQPYFTADENGDFSAHYVDGAFGKNGRVTATDTISEDVYSGVAYFTWPYGGSCTHDVQIFLEED